MSEEVSKFIQQSQATLETISARLGGIQVRLDDGSSLRKQVAGFATTRDALAKKVADLQPDQPLDAGIKRDIQIDLTKLKRQVSRVNEGIQFAVDPQPPRLGSWIWFAAEVLIIVGMAWLYLHLHEGRPLRVFLKGVTPEARVELALQAAELKNSAVAEEPDTGALAKSVTAFEAAFEKAGFAPDDEKAFGDVVGRIQAELARGDEMNGEVIGVHVDRIVDDVLKAEEPFFWARGVGRYIEVLFALFFGVMTFALYNTWEYMRHPGRSWWVAWHIAKVFMALVLGFVTIVILSQVNFVTPSSLENQTALGLGLAPIELLIAVSALTGYFSHRMLGFLDRYANKVFGAPAQ